MKHRTFPCAECPWRRDAEPGKFGTERYETLRATCRSEGVDGVGHSALQAPIFGCHKGEPGTGDDLACAGFLAVEGYNSLPVRLAMALGNLPPGAVRRGKDWPELYGSYEELAEANGVDLPAPKWAGQEE